jgi:hypothetical protein
MCPIKLVCMSEPNFFSLMRFLLVHHPYHAMHAIDEINRLKIFWLKLNSLTPSSINVLKQHKH